MASEGTRGSPHSRFNDPCSYPSKARRLWLSTHNFNFSSPKKKTNIVSTCYLLYLRCINNKDNLPPTNRPKGINSLFLGWPHENSSIRNIYPISVRYKRGTYFNDSTRSYFFRPILPSETALRAERDSNSFYNSWFQVDYSPPNNMMNDCLRIQPWITTHP